MNLVSLLLKMPHEMFLDKQGPFCGGKCIYYGEDVGEMILENRTDF